MSHYGVISMGIKMPLVREGDNLVETIVPNINMSLIDDKTIIGITESLVARAQGNYVTVDEIAEEIKKVMGNPDTITIYQPIYSRNRFAMILKGIARAAGSRVRVYMPLFDEVGNTATAHQFTGVDYRKYYTEIIEAEGKTGVIFPWDYNLDMNDEDTIYCGLHNFDSVKKGFPNIYTLADFFTDKCKYGLLGSNKATEEKIKLFPNTEKAQKLCDDIKAKIKLITGRNVYVCVYGDGCFKDPVGGIWEFADPITMPAYTDKEVFENTPHEVKLKALIDDGNSNEKVAAIIKLKPHDETGMSSQGTTPRKIRDLLASLMDLTSGSGDRGTPVVIVKNYFTNYTSD